MIAVLMLTGLLQSGVGMVRTVQSQLVQDRISALIQEKSADLDLSFYEQSGYYDKLHRARNDAAHKPLELIESLGSLAQNSITLVAMASVLIPYSIWAPLALIVSTLPALYVVLDHRIRYYRWRMENTENERRTWYYDWMLASRENAAEIRIFELGSYFRGAFNQLRRRLRGESIRLYKVQALAELASSFFALAVTGFAMAWMAWQVVAGTVSMGDLALFYQAFNQGQRLMRTLLENVGQMYSSSLFLEDFFEFLGLEPQVKDPVRPVPLPAPLAEGISFNGVTFRYPDADKAVLENFDLTFEAGRTTAIVGANGAGKSTLIKLLCRLYDPESGSVTFDGRDTRSFMIREVRQVITVLFQEPVRYNATVAENISMGDLDSAHDVQAIVQAAQASGADKLVGSLPDGYNTRLGRWFAGSRDLSGGEWQRIALARAFFRKSPIIVLDEPTSAMDSWSEVDWLQRFRQLASGRTAIIIAHRFTTAMQADIIHVMDKGRIIESGSHVELVGQGGRYADSWLRQVRSGTFPE